MTRRKKLAIIAAIVLGLAAAAVGIAAWVVSGSGNAVAQSSSILSLVVTNDATKLTTKLRPGASADVQLNVENPNDFPVTLTSVVSNGVITSDNEVSCPGAVNITFTNQTGLSRSIAAGATASVVLANAASML